jgi:hypothetical protein
VQQQINFNCVEDILLIEKHRHSRVIILACSNLEMDILPTLYRTLLNIGKVERLDVVLHCKGGVVNATRRIALLLRQFCDHLCFIVPFYCESSGTILTLAADEIIAGEIAIFTPIDPQLYGGDEQNGASSMSYLDIKKFGEMSSSWFGIDAQDANLQSLPMLCNSIFPPSLTAFYRSSMELALIAEELLAFQLPKENKLARQAIVEQLMSHYHSHHYALTPDDLLTLGLKIKRDNVIEPLAWRISQAIQTIVGGGLRQDIDSPWYDTLIASRDGVELRQHRSGGFMPVWLS